ncbi:hypothetical protein BDW22DRAFT_1310907, partial [Trametopsis cervina]
TVLSNCTQPLGRDWEITKTKHTFISSCGTYGNGTVTFPDLAIQFRYPPGSMMSFCGGVLRHEVRVSGGESL